MYLMSQHRLSYLGAETRVGNAFEELSKMCHSLEADKLLDMDILVHIMLERVQLDEVGKLHTTKSEQ